ncbi:TIR domain-containing protein [Desemzia incerta]|uniref:TIR domain-containing protein n=1 Tax=Desemzia incerta TaxID=82801 RepID=UPI003D03BF28
MSEKHKCFISFKMVDEKYKKYIQDELSVEMIDKSLNEKINSADPEYVMRVIRRDYLRDSTVTIHLIGERSGENDIFTDQYYIKKELQASLSNSSLSYKSGILGVVLPEMTDKIYTGSHVCDTCGGEHRYVNINGNTVTEFSYNYFIPNEKCAWADDDRYCILVKWEDFIISPNHYIDLAFEKRSEPIADKTRVRPK